MEKRSDQSMTTCLVDMFKVYTRTPLFSREFCGQSYTLVSSSLSKVENLVDVIPLNRDNRCMSPFAITAFYKFIPIAQDNLESTRGALLATGDELGIKGLILVAAEGINGTVAGRPEAIASLKEYLNQTFGSITFKDSTAAEQPFRRWLIKIRTEIVHIGDTEVVPSSEENNHLTPDEWNKILESEDVVLIDTRNTYETEIGMFEGAIDPKMEKFTDFPEYVKNCDIPKDKKVLMYCTGGIRCEKASIEMQRQGYKHVYQLKGGILQYLQEHPYEKFKGECFVFDHRAAVNQELLPSEKYTLCPHCGDPGDQDIRCIRCTTTARICNRCAPFQERNTCSKDCAHHIQLKNGLVAQSHGTVKQRIK